MKDKPHTTTLQSVLSPVALERMRLLKKEALAAQTQEQDQERVERKRLQEKLRKKRDRSTETIAWLERRFPNCFNSATPKPLKIKIETDLFQAIEGDETMSRIRIRQALGFYTTRLAYHESFLIHETRCDLTGNPIEPIDESHRDFSKTRIEEIKARLKGSKS
jgi:sRNA-binding protein